MKKVTSFFINLTIYLGIFAAIFAGSVYFGYLYITPISYVTLDCEHPLEFSVNTFDRVIKVKGDDENNIIALKLTNMEIAKALQKTVSELEAQGHISNDSHLIISLSNEEENGVDSMKKLQEKIKINLHENYDVQMVKTHSN